jgi:hypothetical protein
MSADDFRSMALSLPEAVESEHMRHPDFRVRKKIFATLGPDESWGVVMLTPAEQKRFIKSEPRAFVPVKGGWGLKGATTVQLAAATHETVRDALVAAWRKIAPKRLVEEFDAQ